MPLAAVLALVVLSWLGRSWWPGLEQYLAAQGTNGYLVFLGAFVLLTTVCFPVSVLGFSAGLLYGPWVGLGLIFSGGLLSGSLMFLLGRVLFLKPIRAWVQRDPRLAAVDRLAEEKALKLNIMARLSPLNYGLVCYTLASGRSAFGPYLVGLVATLPSMVGQTWLGSLARESAHAASGQETASRVEVILIVVGLVFFIGLSWQIGRMARQAWLDAPQDSGES